MDRAQGRSCATEELSVQCLSQRGGGGRARDVFCGKTEARHVGCKMAALVGGCCNIWEMLPAKHPCQGAPLGLDLGRVPQV